MALNPVAEISFKTFNRCWFIARHEESDISFDMTLR